MIEVVIISILMIMIGETPIEGVKRDNRNVLLKALANALTERRFSTGGAAGKSNEQWLDKCTHTAYAAKGRTLYSTFDSPRPVRRGSLSLSPSHVHLSVARPPPTAQRTHLTRSRTRVSSLFSQTTKTARVRRGLRAP